MPRYVDDIHAIIQLYMDAGTPLPRPNPELCENARDCAVGEDSNHVIRCGALHLYSVHLAEIGSIAVQSAANAHGAGRAVMNTIMEDAKCRGGLRVPLHSHVGVFRPSRNGLPSA